MLVLRLELKPSLLMSLSMIEELSLFSISLIVFRSNESVLKLSRLSLGRIVIDDIGGGGGSGGSFRRLFVVFPSVKVLSLLSFSFSLLSLLSSMLSPRLAFSSSLIISISWSCSFVSLSLSLSSSSRPKSNEPSSWRFSYNFSRNRFKRSLSWIILSRSTSDVVVSVLKSKSPVSGSFTCPWLFNEDNFDDDFGSGDFLC